MKAASRLLCAVVALVCATGVAGAAPTPADYQIRFWEARLDRDAEDPFTPARLGEAYARKARESGDATYYLRADRTPRQSLGRPPENYNALALLGWVQIGQHRLK